MKKFYEEGTFEYNLGLVCRSASINGVGKGQKQSFNVKGLMFREGWGPKLDGGDWIVTFERVR